MQKHIDSVNKWFDKALGLAKAAEEKKKSEDEAKVVEEAEKKPEVSEGLRGLDCGGWGGDLRKGVMCSVPRGRASLSPAFLPGAWRAVPHTLF